MPRLDPEIRRQAIVDTASELFHKNGFDEVRIEDILTEAGISKGGFYHHFKSKEGILRQLVVEETGSMILEVSEEIESNNPTEALLHLFSSGSVLLGSEVGILSTLGGFQSKTVYLDELERQFSIKLKPLLANILESGVRNGVFKKVDCTSTAEIICAVNDHGNRCAILNKLEGDQLKSYYATALESLATFLGVIEEMNPLIDEIRS